MRYDWTEITSLAYLTLLELDLRKLPIPSKKIRCKGVMVTSYQKYAEITNSTINQLTFGNELEDAFFLKGLRPELKIILYNKEKYDARLKHTLWHEIGHIKLNHEKHGEKEEIEAHFFAGQANAPNVLIKAIAQRGYNIDTTFLVECFGLSDESARKKMDYLGRYGFDHTNEYDDVVLLQFQNYIDTIYPYQAQRAFDEYYYEMEQERESWF